MDELHKICRICLKSDILASIYSPTFLIRPIEMLQKLQIKADDGLPSLLCQSCLYRLLDAYNLQQLAEASERRLKEYFGLTSASCSVVSNLAADISVTPILPTHSTTPNIDLIKPEGECSSSSMYANICDMMFDRHDVTNDMVEVVGGTDDVELLNDVEIDVSSLTRSEADENTLGDVFATKSRLTLETSFVNNRLNANFKLQDQNSQLPLFDGPMENKIADLSLRKHKNMSSIKALRKSLKTPDECLECGKIFPYKGYLEIHKRVHSGEKPFKCQVNNKYL